MAVAGRKNVVVVLGLSPASSREVAELRRLGNHVLQIKNAKVADQVRIAGRTFDLKQAAEVSAFSRTMGLSEERASKVSAAIASGGSNMRDELAQLALIWARAERTHVLPGRMVISGEHMIGIFQSKNGARWS